MKSPNEDYYLKKLEELLTKQPTPVEKELIKLFIELISDLKDREYNDY